MQCERCSSTVEKGEERELHSRILCEDCYMDLLSPARACDPWAVHSAKNLLSNQKHKPHLNQVQDRILEILLKYGSVEPGELVDRLQIKGSDLERELASLRHMEKIRGELKNGKRLIRAWD